MAIKEYFTLPSLKNWSFTIKCSLLSYPTHPFWWSAANEWLQQMQIITKMTENNIPASNVILNSHFQTCKCLNEQYVSFLKLIYIYWSYFVTYLNETSKYCLIDYIDSAFRALVVGFLYTTEISAQGKYNKWYCLWSEL